jgi:hypothetical protein
VNIHRAGRRGEEGKRGRGEEGKRGRGEEGKRGRGEEGKRGAIPSSTPAPLELAYSGTEITGTLIHSGAGR